MGLNPGIPATGTTGVRPPRDENRVSLRLELLMWGTDATGKGFRATAETVDVSIVGARVLLPSHEVAVETIVGVQYKGQKCRCRVIWRGRPGFPDEGQIGIRCVDEAECPWAEIVTLKTIGNKSPLGDAARAERRQAPRYPCSQIVDVRRTEDNFSGSAKVTDISLRGCYLETMSPWAMGTDVMITFHIEDVKIPVIGVVRTIHPAMGNGIEFTKITPEAYQGLEKFVLRLAHQGTNQKLGPAQENAAVEKKAPVVEAPTRQSALEMQLKALVELLEKKSLLSKSELREMELDISLREEPEN
ncbi:MAG TPA: PilZ domain-containing protein [Terriglobales bacterium]|nr:PilZ domain-containing protein [Terriglobales bacterium]